MQPSAGRPDPKAANKVIYLFLDFGDGHLICLGRAEKRLAAPVGNKDVARLAITGELNDIFLVTGPGQHTNRKCGTNLDAMVFPIGEVHALARQERVRDDIGF